MLSIYFNRKVEGFVERVSKDDYIIYFLEEI